MQLSLKEEKLLRRIERMTWQRKFAFVLVCVLLILLLAVIVHVGWMVHTRVSGYNMPLSKVLFLDELYTDSCLPDMPYSSRTVLLYLTGRFRLYCVLFIFFGLFLVDPIMLGRREHLIRKLSGRLRELGEMEESA